MPETSQCCELSLKPNWLLAAAAWPYVLLSELWWCDKLQPVNSWLSVHFRRRVLEVWDGQLRTDRGTFFCYVSICGPQVTTVVLMSVRMSVGAISTLRPGWRWLLVFTASCTVVTSPSVDHKLPPSSCLFWDVRVSKNDRWHLRNTLTTTTLTTDVHRIQQFRHRCPGHVMQPVSSDTPTVAYAVSTASRHYEVICGEPTQLMPLFNLALQML